MIKIAVFDLDGTLVNSLTDIAQSVNKGLIKAGLEEKPFENFNHYVGDGREVMIKRAMGSFAEDEEGRCEGKEGRKCRDGTTAER